MLKRIKSLGNFSLEKDFKPLSLKTLLSLLGITLVSASKNDSQEVKALAGKGFTPFWPSLIMFSLGTWLAGLALGDGILAFLGTHFPSEEESRYTVIISSFTGALGLAAAYLIFISFKGIFPRMLAVSTALGCEYLIVMAIAGEGYSFFWATIAALLLLVLMAKLFTDSAHQIGSAAIFCTILTFLIANNFRPYLEPIMIVLTLPVAIGTLFYPMKGLDLRPLGMVFLLCPLMIALYGALGLSSYSYAGYSSFVMADTISRIVYMAFYILLMYLLWPALSIIGKRFILITFIPVLFLSLLSSSGIAASFFVLFISYILKSRLVMSVGLITNIIFTVLFYFSLRLDTDEKAGLLLLTGLIIIGAIVWLKHSIKGVITDAQKP